MLNSIVKSHCAGPCLIVCLLLALVSCGQQTQSLALGTLERDRVLLKATAAEIITQLPIQEGRDLQAGELVVQLDNHRQQAMVAKAEAQLASAQASLQKLQHGARPEDIAALRAQLSGAQAQLVEAQKAFARAETLVRKKLVGAAELDSARAKRDSAQALVNQSEENLLVLTNGSRSEDLQQAEAQVALAQASLTLEQQNLRELSIIATQAGRLDQLPKNLGERSSLGEVVAVILSNAAPYARVYVPETHRLKLKAGQSLAIHIDGINAPLQGTLRWVSQDPAFTPYFALNSSDRARLMYLAEIDLPASAAELPSGIPVQVELPHD